MKNTTSYPKINEQKSIDLLFEAYQAWSSASDFRQRRERYKQYTYGQQWNDLVEMPSGEVVAEKDLARINGKQPLTNNLIRRLVKSVVGKFRTGIADKNDDDPVMEEISEYNSLDELDSRLLEEFLISGCAVQHIRGTELSEPPVIENVNPTRFFVGATSDPRGTDIEMIGHYEDFSFAELLTRFADNDRRKVKILREIYSESDPIDISSKFGLSLTDDNSFFCSSKGRCRVYEIWKREIAERLRCHDPLTGAYYTLPVGEETAIKRQNRKRQKESKPTVNYKWEMITLWRCAYVSPYGDTLKEEISDAHPYAVKFYPFTDGEIHSFVEDVIDQQRYVNRLITLIDHIMSSSAKGVLLFPEDQKPTAQSWEQVVSAWASYNGIIAYKPQRGIPGPSQVVTNGGSAGAYELLSLEMKLFEDISGVTDALQGKQAQAGMSASLYQQQTQNAVVALADLFETFDDFRARRDTKVKKILTK